MSGRGRVVFWVCEHCGHYYVDHITECDCTVGQRKFRRVEMVPATDLAAAIARCEAAERDAERWRFIVDRYQGTAFAVGNKQWELRFSFDFLVPDDRGYGAVNAAIDAAIAAQQAEGE